MLVEHSAYGGVLHKQTKNTLPYPRRGSGQGRTSLLKGQGCKHEPRVLGSPSVSTSEGGSALPLQLEIVQFFRSCHQLISELRVCHVD